MLRERLGSQAATDNFQHRAELELQLQVLARLDLIAHCFDDALDGGKFGCRADLRHHDFRIGIDARLLAFGSRLEDCPDLHAVNFRERQAQAHATVAKHRVDLIEHPHLAQHGILACDCLGDDTGIGQHRNLGRRLAIMLHHRQRAAEHAQAFGRILQLGKLGDVVL